MPGGVRLRVRVQPRAREAGLAGIRDGALVIRLAEPPVDGRANAGLCRYLARWLGVAPSAVTVSHGLSGRDKVVQVEGVDAARVREALAAAGAPHA